GIGGQPKASQFEAARHLEASRNRSHTTPLTVAAELGAVGILAYLAFLAGAARSLFAVATGNRALGIGLAAVFLTLLVHSLFYSGFFEDPITWGVLAVGAAALAGRAAGQGAPSVDGTGTSEEIATLDGSSDARSAPLAVDRVES